MISVYRHAPEWPFRMRSWVRAANVDYSLELMGIGRFQMDVPVGDEIATGDLITFRSSEGLPDWVGYVERIEQSESGAALNVSGLEWAGILGQRVIAQERVYPSGASGDIARELVRLTNARSQTGISVLSTSPGAPLLSPLFLRSASPLDGLTQLSALTGWEWQVIYQAGATAKATFIWRAQAGRDLRNSYRLSGKMILDAEMVEDTIKDSAVVQVIGSLGEYRDRPSSVAVADAPIALQDVATVKIAMTSDKTRKPSRRRGIFERREMSILESSLPDGLATQRLARESLLSAISGAETLTLTASNKSNWAYLVPGNIISVQLSWGERPFRIYGVQPDDGVCRLVGKVLP